MNLRVRSVTGCSLSAIFAGGRVDYSAYDENRDRYRGGGCRWGSLSIEDLRKV